MTAEPSTISKRGQRAQAGALGSSFWGDWQTAVARQKRLRPGLAAPAVTAA